MSDVDINGLDIFEFPAQTVSLAVVPNIVFSMLADVPKGCKKIKVKWPSPNVGGGELCFLRWNADPTAGTDAVLTPHDEILLRVPQIVSPRLRVIGGPSVTAGTILYITPIG